nr:upf0481 protein [Quercus suber]
MGCKESAIDIPLVMEPVQWPERCIYRVPKKLREVNNDAYTLKLISIGPLHHGECKLHAMEMLKLRYLREFCYRTRTCHKDIKGVIETNELKIRRCYEEIFDTSSEDFVKMVVLDSIFIIEHFLRSAASDRLFNRNPACGEDESYASEEDGCCNARGDEKDCILRVIFKKADGRRLLDIQFKKSNLTEIFPCFTCSWLLRCLPFLKRFPCLVNTQTFLEIPCLEEHDETEGIFRNLMALEQCHYPFEAYICNFMVLLDFLINTTEDVESLVEKGIMVNKLGSNKAVAIMVNKLGLEIEQKGSCYLELAQRLNRYYANDCNRNMGSLRTIYFGDIWRGTASFIGTIVLLVTILNFLRPFFFKIYI